MVWSQSNGRLVFLCGFAPFCDNLEIKIVPASPISMNLSSGYSKLDGLLATLGGWLQPVLLLVIRGWWGWSFFLTGKGKLLNLEKTTAFFTDLGLPMPKLNAIMAGSTECFGGLLLLLGLGSRLLGVPVIFPML